MGTRYNALAGHSVERLAALSDGLFAVAMTLLVLDLKVPAGHAIETDQALLEALRELAPRLVVYLMSFLTLGIFWVGQQMQLSHFARSDRNPALWSNCHMGNCSGPYFQWQPMAYQFHITSGRT